MIQTATRLDYCLKVVYQNGKQRNTADIVGTQNSAVAGCHSYWSDRGDAVPMVTNRVDR